MLMLRDIKKDYLTGSETVNALKGVSISFRKSEFVSILGQSGCGKTTLLNIIGGLDQYTSGDLVINGTSTKDYKDKDWDTYRNHSIGFVFQSYNLITHQTVLANVELALTLSGVSKEERRKRAKEALERVGLGDQLRKKPTQMSGGQMQRVAIARALVNNPDILLADEPTGALDSNTSVQIMDILKEIAREKLVIMVTHNGDLAEEYSTRIIRLHDGLVTSDSNPYSEKDLLADEAKEKESQKVEIVETEVEIQTTKKSKKVKKTKKSMSFFTALSLSFNNLMTKKGRTILTAFAGSIGIIGIALILSLSTGIKSYINQVQEETLSGYPVTLERKTTNLQGLLDSIMGATSEDDVNHSMDKVYSDTGIYELLNSLHQIGNIENDLKSFKTYLEENKTVHSDYITAVQYAYDLPLNITSIDTITGDITEVNPSEVLTSLMALFNSTLELPDSTGSTVGMMGIGQVFCEIIPSLDGGYVNDMIYNQYDLIYGSWPDEADELILILDENNEISDLTLYALGIKGQAELNELMDKFLQGEDINVSQTSMSYQEICERMEYRLVLPTSRYEKIDGVWTDVSQDPRKLLEIISASKQLKIKGIIKPKEGVTSTALSGSVGYTSALTEWFFNTINEAEIVKEQRADKTIDVFSNLPFKGDVTFTPNEQLDRTNNYINGLDDNGKVEFYKKMIPNIAYFQQFGNKDAAYLKEHLIEMMTSLGMDTSQLDGFDMSTVSDEQFMTIFNTRMKPLIIAGLETQMVGQKSDAEILGMGSAIISQADETVINFVFETYVPTEFSNRTYEENVIELGIVDVDTPSKIHIFAKDFDGKEKINEMLENYNNDVDTAQKISYTDYVGLAFGGVSTIIDAISYVLIGFVSVSLVVSSIMIGIITYISVLERTKEIGILRAIGASKRDVSRVFRAETVIEGFAAGLFGISITLLLCIPINLILRTLSGIPGLKAQLPIGAAIILVIISILLTLVAGMLPSRVAAKKDPVEELRTE